MLTYYLTLGLSPDVSDAEIRKRYLELVRENPPGRNPERFRKITAAYETLKDRRTRIVTQIYGELTYGDYETALLDLARARSPERRRVSLKDLLPGKENTHG
jgi:curved DNA-binding protein CbpA